MLGETFEQYKKLWMEYLKLRNYCEGANVKLPFQLFEPESVNDIMTQSQASKNCKEVPTMLISQTSENPKVSSSVYESIPTVYSSDNTLNPNETVLSDDRFIQKEIDKNKLLHSPVLIRERVKLKKSAVTPGHSILDDSEESNAFVPVKENITILLNSSQEDTSEALVEFKENECSYVEKNDDEVECTPLCKLPKKLGISKLYNVDTTFLQSGKKLKQSRLVFFPTEPDKENIDHKKQVKLTPLKLCTSPASERNTEQNTRDFGSIKPLDEEIIEDSPTKRKESRLKIKNLKLKKKSPTRLLEKSNKKGSDMVSKFNNNKTDAAKLFLSNVHTSTQNSESCSIKRLETFNTPDSENVGSGSGPSSSPLSLIFINNDHLNKLSSKISEEEIENVDIIGKGNQLQKRKLSKLLNESSNYNSSECDDETFCLLGERLIEKSTTSIGNIKGSKYDLSESISDNSPPAKKSLMHSFDMVPEKEDVFIEKTKNKAERAKMSGISCWECKKYYANLGLSEKEIKARQNQCSRHRIKHKEKQSTPDGFWDPLFPDTFSSSFEGDF
nr:uncharacterized protein LOC116430556 isoform X1 [Nomia melanderi]